MYLIFLLYLLEFSEGIQITPRPPESHSGYRNYEKMTHFIHELTNNYSDIVEFYSIGRSVEEKELWVLKISGVHSSSRGIPNIKFIGNIHGNEPVGRELILNFAEYLAKNYETDSEVRWIMDRTNIYLLPSLNPDGFERSKEGECYSGPGRENGHLVDLNRSFPDHFQNNNVPIQPETLAMAEWTLDTSFVLSASFHGGALVANYPFDGNPSSERDLLSPRYSPTPDDDVFKHLAQTYSSNHLTMHKGRTCNENQPSFPGGITNGAAWYSFTGGMQDFNYVSRGCMELTLEVSCCKYPESHHLPRLWDENKRAMLELAKQSQIGLKGLVMDKTTALGIPGATLHISGRGIPFTTSKYGEFWRILLPGFYTLIVQAKGYESQSFPFTVEPTDSSRPNATWLNIYLQPSDDLVAEPSNIIQVSENAADLRCTSSLILNLLLSVAVSLFTRNHIS